INKNSQIPQLQDTVMSLATELCKYDARYTPMLSQLAQQFGMNIQAMQGAQAFAGEGGSASLETNALGEAMRTSKATTAATAAQRASEMASLK
ncbi:MAG: hypothetical protein ACI4SJ_07210, partial [Candidatus Avispirillum sp.]